MTEGSKRRSVEEMVDGSLALTSAEGAEAAEKVKRRSLLAQAVVGDLVIAYSFDPLDEERPTTVKAIEQVSDHSSAEEIVERWKDLGIIGAKDKPEVWECRPGGYYRRRKAGR